MAASIDVIPVIVPSLVSSKKTSIAHVGRKRKEKEDGEEVL
jgi:hypothetical protein